ncbi:aminoacyl-tRNA deacylase [Saccharothrix obliqua]|uniref:aminoacyl-tRNA deacylase n=1 Tax=Saccharothrix obliqua TaxID=2861747 RepID=UPI001C604ABC|nr:YbaK/EbsC family protein [Saccharothrix obliqua]MBW4717087.1 YbaK/EbsC family protein [Saccharothrix obliqua]
MSGATPAQILSAAGVPFATFRHTPIRTHQDVERELGLPTAQLLKTLAFRADGRFVLVSMPMALPANYGRIARAAGVPRARLRRADEEDLAVLGMAPGGISPLTEVADRTVVFHTSVPDMGTVYCGSGRADETIEVAAASLVALVDPVLADVAG